mmetsp:Transcript_93335/g.194760  ORF Transcript_93335/g.194760 Transcript_93335/m.194760 type:complete len:338 (+) Transcript_93335:77-1090(+)
MAPSLSDFQLQEQYLRSLLDLSATPSESNVDAEEWTRYLPWSTQAAHARTKAIHLQNEAADMAIRAKAPQKSWEKQRDKLKEEDKLLPNGDIKDKTPKRTGVFGTGEKKREDYKRFPARFWKSAAGHERDLADTADKVARHFLASGPMARPTPEMGMVAAVGKRRDIPETASLSGVTDIMKAALRSVAKAAEELEERQLRAEAEDMIDADPTIPTSAISGWKAMTTPDVPPSSLAPAGWAFPKKASKVAKALARAVNRQPYELALRNLAGGRRTSRSKALLTKLGMIYDPELWTLGDVAIMNKSENDDDGGEGNGNVHGQGSGRMVRARPAEWEGFL